MSVAAKAPPLIFNFFTNSGYKILLVICIRAIFSVSYLMYFNALVGHLFLCSKAVTHLIMPFQMCEPNGSMMKAT